MREEMESKAFNKMHRPDTNPGWSPTEDRTLSIPDYRHVMKVSASPIDSIVLHIMSDVTSQSTETVLTIGDMVEVDYIHNGALKHETGHLAHIEMARGRRDSCNLYFSNRYIVDRCDEPHGKCDWFVNSDYIRHIQIVERYSPIDYKFTCAVPYDLLHQINGYSILITRVRRGEVEYSYAPLSCPDIESSCIEFFLPSDVLDDGHYTISLVSDPAIDRKSIGVGSIYVDHSKGLFIPMTTANIVNSEYLSDVKIMDHFNGVYIADFEIRYNSGSIRKALADIFGDPRTTATVVINSKANGNIDKIRNMRVSITNNRYHSTAEATSTPIMNYRIDSLIATRIFYNVPMVETLKLEIDDRTFIASNLTEINLPEKNDASIDITVREFASDCQGINIKLIGNRIRQYDYVIYNISGNRQIVGTSAPGGIIKIPFAAPGQTYSITAYSTFNCKDGSDHKFDAYRRSRMTALVSVDTVMRFPDKTGIFDSDDAIEEFNVTPILDDARFIMRGSTSPIKGVFKITKLNDDNTKSDVCHYCNTTEIDPTARYRDPARDIYLRPGKYVISCMIDNYEYAYEFELSMNGDNPIAISIADGIPIVMERTGVEEAPEVTYVTIQGVVSLYNEYIDPFLKFEQATISDIEVTDINGDVKWAVYTNCPMIINQDGSVTYQTSIPNNFFTEKGAMLSFKIRGFGYHVDGRRITISEDKRIMLNILPDKSNITITAGLYPTIPLKINTDLFNNYYLYVPECGLYDTSKLIKGGIMVRDGSDVYGIIGYAGDDPAVNEAFTAILQDKDTTKMVNLGKVSFDADFEPITTIGFGEFYDVNKKQINPTYVEVLMAHMFELIQKIEEENKPPVIDTPVEGDTDTDVNDPTLGEVED